MNVGKKGTVDKIGRPTQSMVEFPATKEWNLELLALSEEIIGDKYPSPLLALSTAAIPWWIS